MICLLPVGVTYKFACVYCRPVRLVVRTPGFQPGNRSSILLRVTAGFTFVTTDYHRWFAISSLAALTANNRKQPYHLPDTESCFLNEMEGIDSRAIVFQWLLFQEKGVSGIRPICVQRLLCSLVGR